MNKAALNPIIEYLTKAGEEGGYLFSLRYRKFDYNKGQEFLNCLRSIDLSKDESFDKQLIRLIWYIPIFSVERIQDFRDNNLLSDDEFVRFSNQLSHIQAELDRIIFYD